MKTSHFYTILFFGAITAISCSSSLGVDYNNWLENKPDDYYLPEYQKEITRHNAEILAFRDHYAKDSTFIDIPEKSIDFFYDCLVTILQSEAALEQVEVQNLKIFEPVNLYGILAEPHEGAPFIEAWNDSIITTDIPKIDNLLLLNGFEITNIIEFFNEETEEEETTYIYALEATKPLNTVRIATLLEKTGYFSHAEIDAVVGDGGNIKLKYKGDTIEFTFIHKYGDCPSGCIESMEYTFKLYKDGFVEIVGEEYSGL